MSLEPTCAHGECNEVWWRPCPTNLPPPVHEFISKRSYFDSASLVFVALEPAMNSQIGKYLLRVFENKENKRPDANTVLVRSHGAANQKLIHTHSRCLLV